MNIIIIGSGTVGTEICSLLAKDGHAITVIDNDQVHTSRQGGTDDT